MHDYSGVKKMTTWTEEITSLYESLGDDIKKWKDGVHNEQTIYQALNKIKNLLGNYKMHGSPVRTQELHL